MRVVTSCALLLATGAAARAVHARGAGNSGMDAVPAQSLFCAVGDQKALLNGRGRRRKQCTSALARLRGGAKDDDEKVEGDCIGTCP